MQVSAPNLCQDQVLEATPCQSHQTPANSRDVWRGGRHVSCHPGSPLEGRVPSTGTSCKRAHPIVNTVYRTETKAIGAGQGGNSESAGGLKFTSCKSREGGKFGRRQGTEARRIVDRGEDHSVTIPGRSTCKRRCRVGTALGVRLRRRDGICFREMSTVEANQIPADNQELESWMNLRAVEGFNQSRSWPKGNADSTLWRKITF